MRARCLGVIATLVFACALLSAACDSPVGPTAAAANGAQTLAVLSPSQSHAVADGDGLSPEVLAAQGWACRPVPSNAALTQCFPPPQGFPVVPPPDDRPPSYSVLLFEGEDYVGKVLLIRPDLYRGQICQSTGQPYRYIALVGYYECTFRPGN